MTGKGHAWNAIPTSGFRNELECKIAKQICSVKGCLNSTSHHHFPMGRREKQVGLTLNLAHPCKRSLNYDHLLNTQLKSFAHHRPLWELSKPNQTESATKNKEGKDREEGREGKKGVGSRGRRGRKRSVMLCDVRNPSLQPLSCRRNIRILARNRFFSF